MRQYTAAEHATLSAHRQAARSGGIYVEPEPKIAFVIRLRGVNQVRQQVLGV